MRIDSSNFDPAIAFGTGAQCVALNFQNKDRAMLINYGLFIKNGGVKSGYVKKPASLLNNSLNSDYYTKIKMKLISAQNLGRLLDKSKNTLDTFVYFELEVVDFIDAHKNFRNKFFDIHRTSACQYNLFHPVWKNQDDLILKVVNEEATIITIKVFLK